MPVLLRTQDGFSDLIGLIYEAARNQDLLPEMLTRVADHLGASGGMIVRNDFRPGLTWIRVGRLDPGLTEVYVDRHVDNPYTRAFASVPEGQVVLASDMVDRDAVRRTALHADILAPQRIGDMVVCPYAPWRSNKASGGVSFTILDRDAHRSREVLHRFRRIAPHLTRSLDLASLLSARTASDEPLRMALDCAPSAAFLLDGGGRILHRNGAAEVVLRQGDGLTARHDRLVATTAAGRGGLADLLAGCGSGSEGGTGRAGGTLRIARPSGLAPYLLCVIPLPATAPRFAGPDEPGMLLFVSGADSAHPGTAATLLRRLFGLTAAEAKVGALIATGIGISAAARSLAVSHETARRQLSVCFAKLGVNSQAALARLVTSLPALDPDA